jgi:hypothetical protein
LDVGPRKKGCILRNGRQHDLAHGIREVTHGNNVADVHLFG